METYYTYTFKLCRAPGGVVGSSVMVVLLNILPELSLELTEERFNKFREELKQHGLGLRDITRVPYVPPEKIP